MKRLAIPVALALLTGCATPTELKQDGIRTHYTLRLPPDQAARCLARNAEEYFGGFGAQVRETEAPGILEVHVRMEQLLAVAHIEPKGGGSSATIWRGRIPLIAWGLPEAMAKGC